MSIAIEDKDKIMKQSFPDKLFAKKFPDGTQNIRLSKELLAIPRSEVIYLRWDYESDKEMSTLYFLTKDLQSRGYVVSLIMPYIPNARMDRVNNEDEVFTLKYFTMFINDLNFKEVRVLDAHSPVSLALIDRVVQQDVSKYISDAIYQFQPDVLFMPDEGAHKRYASMFKEIPSTFGIKHRDWRSGEITSYEVAEKEIIKDAKVLIIDDICSKGGTFLFAARALKESGSKDVGLYVTHCEETITQGELLKEDSPVKQIFVANNLDRQMWSQAFDSLIGFEDENDYKKLVTLTRKEDTFK